ncbi:MAG: amidase [Euzebya sp.]
MAHPEATPPTVATDPMASWDAVHTRQAIINREVSTSEVIEAAVQRIQALNPALGALTTTTFDLARDKTRGPSLPAGPLGGVPSAVKDLYDLAGTRTTFCSRASGTHVSAHTEPAVGQFLSTGLVPLGRSVSSEYGMTPTAEPLGFPPAKNPWDTAYSTGGSSGGAGALVAARMVPVAQATDGGGSTRIPASCCGLIGLKPSNGRLVDIEGNTQMPVRLLAAGVLTRTVRDTAAFFAAAEQTRTNPALPPLGLVTRPGTDHLRVALVTSTPVTPVHPEVVAATRYTGKVLEDLGHHVEEVPMPFGAEQLADDFFLYWGLLAQALPVVGRLAVGAGFRRDLLDPWTKGLAQHSRRNLWRLPRAIMRMRRLATDYAAYMSRFHLLVTPTLALPPPQLGWLDVDLPFETHRQRAFAFTPFTPLWNVVGAPAISLPMIRSRDGLPIGVQLGAAMGQERLLLQTALAIEHAVPFNRADPARGTISSHG